MFSFFKPYSVIMKYFILFFLCFGASNGVQSQDSKIKSATITFNFVKKDVSGAISGFSSVSAIDWDSIENSRFEGQVETETLKTGNFVRDWSLKSGKYFDADSFPTITFKSNRVVAQDNGIVVYGTLTLKGTSRPLEITFVKSTSVLIGTATLFTSDFDISIYKNSREDNKVIVTLKLVLE